MTGIYFSGTGNSRYCVEKFLQEYDIHAKSLSIEHSDAVRELKNHREIVIGYPVQFSNLPKILKEFAVQNHDLWRDKQIFIIATMGLFSGDGAGILSRLLSRYGAVTCGGLHLKMPDSICDEKALKRSLEKNRALIRNADIKIEKAVKAIKTGNPPREGLGFPSHLAGLLGQRLYFYNKTKHYTDKLKINPEQCTGCGTCVKICPMKNIRMCNAFAVPGDQCTMCYRCVGRCPARAITLLGKKIYEQCYIEKYL